MTYFQNLWAAILGRTAAPAAAPSEPVAETAAPAEPAAAPEATAAPAAAPIELTAEPTATAAPAAKPKKKAAPPWRLPKLNKAGRVALPYDFYEAHKGPGLSVFTQPSLAEVFEGVARLLIEVQGGDPAATLALSRAAMASRASSFAVARDLASRSNAAHLGRLARVFHLGGSNAFEFSKFVLASTAWTNGYRPPEAAIGFVADILSAMTWEGAPAPTQISTTATPVAAEVPAPAAPAAVEVPSTPAPGAKAARKRARKIAASQR